MKKFLVTLPIVALLTVGTSISAFAYQGSPEKHAQMQEILENKDYQGWVEFVKEKCETPEMFESKLKFMTEENFGKFVEGYEKGAKFKMQKKEEFQKKIGNELKNKRKSFSKQIKQFPQK